MASLYDLYSELHADVKNELNRTDLTDSQIDKFIRIAEKRSWRRLRIPVMENRVSITVTQPDRETDPDGLAESPIPADYLEPILFTSGIGTPIEWISSQQLRKLPTYQSVVNNLAGPTYVSRERNQFKYWPSYSGEVILTYYAEPEPAKYFSDQPTNNGELPEIYDIIGEAIFYGAVSEGWRFVREGEKREQYKAMWKEIMLDTTAQFKDTDTKGSTLVSKNPYL